MKVSIITAVLNRQDTIQEAMEAVARQTDCEIEHIVIDGGSSDGTLEVLNRYRNQIDVFVSERDNGIYDALNKGIRLASGDVIGFLHADDLLADNLVISRISAAFSDPRIDAVYGDLVYVSKRDASKIVRRWRAGLFSLERLAWGWMPPHPTFYVRKGVYERLGAFDTTHRISADYDCILRFLGRGAVVPAYIPDVLVKMRVGGASNRSFANILQKSREDYLALRNNGVGGLGALGWKNLSKIRQFFD